MGEMNMQSYDLYLPTHLVFGKGRVAELGKLAAGRGKRVLITYGGSVRRTGLLDEVSAPVRRQTHRWVKVPLRQSLASSRYLILESEP